MFFFQSPWKSLGVLAWSNEFRTGEITVAPIFFILLHVMMSRFSIDEDEVDDVAAWHGVGEWHCGEQSFMPEFRVHEFYSNRGTCIIKLHIRFWLTFQSKGERGILIKPPEMPTSDFISDLHKYFLMPH